MSNLGLGHHSRRWTIARLCLVSVIALGPAMTATRGHDVYTAFIQHRVHLTAAVARLDITIDLTFFEEWSSRERRRMDASQDGQITKAEIRAYLDKLAPELEDKVRLRIGGADVPLTALYEPALDLLGNNQTGPAHHRLRLFFFAPEPPRMKAGDDLVIEDRLWPDAKALATLELEGRNGCVLERQKAQVSENTDTDSKAISLRIRCLKPPKVPLEPPGGLRVLCP